MIVPVTVAVADTVGDVLGFRPAHVPPLRSSTIRVANVMPDSWASSIGLNTGDFLTHINDVPVSQFLSSMDFYDALAKRPTRLSFLLQVDDADMQSANKQALADKLKHGKGSVDEMFDRLFGPETTSGKSLLFEETSFRPLPALTKQQADALSRSVISGEPPLVGGTQQSSYEANTSRVPTMFEAIEPVRLRVTIMNGINIPTSAGTLWLDPIVQPFSSDPYIEVFVARNDRGIVPTSMTCEELRQTYTPVNIRARATTPVNRDGEWFADFSLPLPNQVIKQPEKFLLIFCLMDSRISGGVDMGASAIPLTAIQPWPSAQKNSLLEQDVKFFIRNSYFDVTQTFLKAKFFLEGKTKSLNRTPQSRDDNQSILDEDYEDYDDYEDIDEDNHDNDVDAFSPSQTEDDYIPWMYRPWMRAVAANQR